MNLNSQRSTYTIKVVNFLAFRSPSTIGFNEIPKVGQQVIVGKLDYFSSVKFTNGRVQSEIIFFNAKLIDYDLRDQLIATPTPIIWVSSCFQTVLKVARIVECTLSISSSQNIWSNLLPALSLIRNLATFVTFPSEYLLSCTYLKPTVRTQQLSEFLPNF